MVWILLKPSEFAQKIDLLIKVLDVAPSTVEKKDPFKCVESKKK